MALRRAARSTRRGVREWIEASECSWCLTLNPNRGLGLAVELSVLRLAFADADEALLGKRFNKVDGRKRLLAFIMPEHVTSNLHFHMAVRPGLPTDPCEERRRLLLLTQKWEERVPSGTCHIEERAEDGGWPHYITKEMWRGEAEFEVSSLWWPERQRRHVLDGGWLDPMHTAAAL